MSDFVVSSNNIRQGAEYNYIIRHLDKTFINLIKINSLNLQVHYFPSFAKLIRKKYCSYQEEEDEDIKEAENICGDQGSFNVCRLMDVLVYEISRFGSRPVDEGSKQPRCSNACIKQRLIYTNHKKYHRLSTLTISFPNRMSIVIRIVSARNQDSAILTQSGLNNIMHNLCIWNNIPIYCLHADNRFLGAQLAIRTPHRGMSQFPLNNRFYKDNEIMKKNQNQN